MNFVKGVILGGVVATGISMACADGMCANKKRMVRMGKQFVRKIGLI